MSVMTPRFTKEDQQALEQLSDHIHLFYHRNRNQHRRSIWWRHFQIFRKQINHLVEELRSVNEVPKTHLERTKKKARDEHANEHIRLRCLHWQDVLVPKWQHVFSQVTADGRFAMLGLVLTASLAEVCRITGITDAFEDLGQAEIEQVLERFAKEGWESDDQGEVVGGIEDVGEVISRVPGDMERSARRPVALDDKEQAAQVRSSLVHQSKRRPAEAGIDTRTKKKKRRKGDAIDDLFSGLA